MKNIREQIILIIAIIFMIFIMLINSYSIKLLKFEVYESHYTEGAELLIAGLKEFYIDKVTSEMDELSETDAVINALKYKNEHDYQKIDQYITSISDFVDYEFIAILDKNNTSIFSKSSNEIDENIILEAYKSLYIDNFSEGIINIPLIDRNSKYNNIYIKKIIKFEGETLGSIIFAISGEEIVNYMKNFDEISFILDPDGNIYLGSEKATNEFSNFLRINSRDELEKNSKQKYKNFSFNVFELNNEGWKIVILQSLNQNKFSRKISIYIAISNILALILIGLLSNLLLNKVRSKITSKKLSVISDALEKVDIKIAIVKDNSEIIYSNHEEFRDIYQNPANLYFKSDVLATIKRRQNLKKHYAFEVDENKKWYILNLKMLDEFESCQCAVISLNEFTNERLYQKKLESIALYDQLTGCYNKDQGLDKIKSDVKIEKDIIELSMIFLDIDNLKLVNDNMGHNMGDILIKSIINTVKDSIRSNDYCIRVGGDEFLIILPNCSYARAAEIIFSIEKQVANINLLECKHTPSFSFGLVNKKVDGSFDLESMINEADAKMYINKKIKKGKKKNEI